MKKIIIILLLISQNIFSQNESKPLVNQDLKEDTIFDFNDVDEIPLSQKCQLKKPQIALKKCVSKSINLHVGKKFNSNIAIKKGLSGKIEINNTFIVNTKGEIVNIISETNDEDLKKEAMRVINLLPKMKPGKHNGKLVNVRFTYPILFSVTN